MSEDSEKIRLQNEIEIMKAQMIVEKSEYQARIGELNNEINQLKEKQIKIMQKSNWISFFSVLVATIGLSIAIYSVYYSFSLNEPYLIPRDPKLNRIWMSSYNSLGKWEFEYVGENTKEAEICFYNEGRAPTGSIRANWDYNISWLSPSFLYIQNIPGGTINCTNIPMIASHLICEDTEPGKTRMKCNKTLIPTGKTIIPLVIECKFCNPSKIYKNITICIFEDSVPMNIICE